MKTILEPDTPGGLVICIASRAASRSAIITEDMAKEISGRDQYVYTDRNLDYMSDR